MTDLTSLEVTHLAARVVAATGDSRTASMTRSELLALVEQTHKHALSIIATLAADE